MKNLKLLLSLVLVLALKMSVQGQVVINEIMYNIPGSGEDEEFLEIFNPTGSPVNVQNWQVLYDNGGTMTVGYTFGNVSIPAGGYFVLAADSAKFTGSFGMSPDAEWSGVLGNGGDGITIYNNMGVMVDSVRYDDATPWATEADGQGYSLQLCSASMDNNDGNNWGISYDFIGFNNQTGTDSIFGTPGAANNVTCTTTPPIAYPIYTIATVTTVDADGVADSLNVTCTLGGIVYGIDYRGGSGLSFTVIDATGGINVYSSSNEYGYTVTEGDSIYIAGTIDQYRGLTEIIPDTLYSTTSGNTLKTPTVVTTLGENTESDLIRVNGMILVDAAEWDTSLSTSGLNVRITAASGGDTLTMRIDADCNIYTTGMAAPTGQFDVIGLGGQYDSSSPYTDGYQIFPRYTTDIIMQSANSKLLGSVDAKVYPTVSNGIYNIELNENVTMNIINVNGKVIVNKKVATGKSTIDLSTFANGVYFIKLTTEKGQKTLKVVKN